LGIAKCHSESNSAFEKEQTASIDQSGKKLNRELAGKRVKVENVIRRLKIFRILSERYRHRHQ
jgi:hypothetical protein